MIRYLLYLNEKRCIACHGCTVHCKTNKNLPVGPILCTVTTSPLKPIKGIPKTVFTFRSCKQCDDPFCVPVCPTKAMLKRDDGIVYIDAEKCIGCMACAKACPWNVPQLNPDTKRAVKCDYCMDRLDQGLKPACVSMCTTQALKLAVVEEIK
jgi:Fe-S-cluster-containing dehydrogenase component